MSKEIETLNIYMEQQLERIRDLNQTIMILETKNRVLEQELEIFRAEKKQKDESQFKRSSFKSSLKQVENRVDEIKDEKPKETTTVSGFSLKDKL